MSTEAERIVALEREVADLRRQLAFNGRLGPSPETQEDIDARRLNVDGRARRGAEVTMTDGDYVYLECPCCGDDGAMSDRAGEFFDGQPLICGCIGHVSVDAESEADPWINVIDDCGPHD